MRIPVLRVWFSGTTPFHLERARVFMGDRQLVVNFGGRWTDWAKVVLGLLAVTTPEIFGGGWPVLGLEDTAGLLLIAAGVWALRRPQSRAPQWFAIGASALLAIWPSVVEPTAKAAPWVGIVAGGLGTLSAIARLHELSGRDQEQY